MRVHGQRTGFPSKTGLYTSPHLIKPEERIRLNFKPLSEDVFARYVSETHEALQCPTEDSQDAPRYLQFLALVAFHTFIKERVDVAIFETHQGGQFDATNVIHEPVVTAITTIAEDHVHQLGPSLEDIAWHKAGIFKSFTPAFSTPQRSSVAAVLQKRATDCEISLEFIDVVSELPAGARQIKPEVQLLNFSLAHAVSNGFLLQKSPHKNAVLSPEDIICGTQQFSWAGRFQSILDGHLTWLIDGAHNKISLEKCAQWFAQSILKIE